ncbi:5'/3'-nucleotidase SurE [Alphaproteobacteria bacterium]|nr:5'/3'-nucleotidase SurE [Alphaproteobacteria bacterium]
MSKSVGRILVTNDDGIDAPGLVSALKIAEALSDDVWVFAPAEEMSGASHSLSLSKPMRVIELGPKRFAVTGTPTDCVMVATRHVLRDNPPDLVLSGVNFGQNIAEDVSYSGTVAGAKEGTVFGIKSIAMSQAVMFTGEPGTWSPRFEVAEKHAPSLIEKLLDVDWPEETLINLNFPHIDINDNPEIRVVKQGKRDRSILGLEERIDPRGRSYFWYNFDRLVDENGDLVYTPGKNTDIEAITQGHIAVTPLKMDHTQGDMAAELATIFE